MLNPNGLTALVTTTDVILVERRLWHIGNTCLRVGLTFGQSDESVAVLVRELALAGSPNGHRFGDFIRGDAQHSESVDGSLCRLITKDNPVNILWRIVVAEHGGVKGNHRTLTRLNQVRHDDDCEDSSLVDCGVVV